MASRLSPSDDIPDHPREAKRQRSEWQGSVPPSGQRTDLFTDLGSRALPPQPNPPTACRTTTMDTQRLLSVLKVIHNEIESLAARVKDLEDVCKEIKEEMSVEFDLYDDSDDSGEESDDSDTESRTSNQSAPASFQY